MDSGDSENSGELCLVLATSVGLRWALVELYRARTGPAGLRRAAVDSDGSCKL